MRGRPWTAADLAILRRDYPHQHTAELAAKLRRPLPATYARANGLGLRKSAEYLATDKSGRTFKGGKRGQVTQFKPGQTSWNKGMRYVAGGRSAETRFRKGNRPHTWVPVGSYRINGDGYLDRKVTDNGRGPRDWIGVHRLVWIDANGPVPPGHVVVFKPGRRTTELAGITLDALELVTRQELMARNTLHRYPKPIAQAIQLRGALNRQINKRVRAHAEQD
jgi:hypothetical protein